MALYCIGDVQGCDAALQRLLNLIAFSPSRDTAYLLGDLVNRGPDSAAVLRRCRAHDGALRSLLGNHDLHLLAVAHGARAPSRRDTLNGILLASDRDALLGRDDRFDRAGGVVFEFIGHDAADLALPAGEP